MFSVIRIRGLVITGSYLTGVFSNFRILVSVSVSVSSGTAGQLDSKMAVMPYSLVETE
jgi:hypothetical protein